MKSMSPIVLQCQPSGLIKLDRQYWMKHSPVCNTQCKKSMPSDPIEEAMVVVVVTVVDVATAVVGVEAETPAQDLQPLQASQHPQDIRGPNILISLLEIGQGAPCTSDTGGGHFSAPSRPHARGRTSSRQSLIINETVTSPATHQILHF